MSTYHVHLLVPHLPNVAQHDVDVLEAVRGPKHVLKLCKENDFGGHVRLIVSLSD